MVQGQQQDVFGVVEPQQHGTQQWPLLQVEGTGGLGDSLTAGLGLTLGGGHATQVHPGQAEGRGRVDALHGLAFARGEGGAQ